MKDCSWKSLDQCPSINGDMAAVMGEDQRTLRPKVALRSIIKWGGKQCGTASSQRSFVLME